MFHAGKEKLAEYLKVTPMDAKSIIDSFLGNLILIKVLQSVIVYLLFILTLDLF
jgi:hypothetical protein